ncbi:MAG: hypothetical protein RR458_03150 [Clostridia bacterium]
MTKSEAYSELKRFRQEIAVSESRRRRLAEIESQLTSIRGTNYEALGVHGGCNDGLEGLIDKVSEAKKDLVNAILRSEEERKKIEKKIEAVEFPYSDVLWRRYINCDSYERISKEMSLRYSQRYSSENVRQMNSRGVEKYCVLKIN